MIKDRISPHDSESEMAVIACCLAEPGTCLNQSIIALKADPMAFYDPKLATIFEAMIQMDGDGKPVDVITLQKHLLDAGDLERVGGTAFLMTVGNSVGSALNLPAYLESVSEKYMLRKLIQTCAIATQDAYSWSENADTLMDKVERSVLSIRQQHSVSRDKSVKELVNEAINEIEQRFNSGGRISGLPTGFIDLDRATDGLHAGEMTVLAAFPSTGKTALAMNIAEHVVLERQVPVGVFSMEMTSVALVKRCLCSCARVDGKEVTAGRMVEDDFKKLTVAAGRLSNAKLYFDDQSDLSIYALRAKARRMVQQHGVKFFVIDYLQLLNATGGPHRTENRQQEVATISNGIKNMAKELGLPVLVLSQLNDDGKLRESRAIGQDADGVWLLEEDKNLHKLTIKKQRNGPRNVVVNLKFLAESTRFESASLVELN